MRQHYIDWLRNIGILFLFVFHTARIYDSMESNYVKGPPNAVCDSIIVSSYWFMPLLFLLAGMSAYFALKKYPAKEYLKERKNRLLIPFVFGLLAVVPPQAYIAQLFHAGTASNYFDFLTGYFTDFTDITGYFGSFTPGHLWFIMYLLAITLALLPLFLRIIRKGCSPKWLYHPLLLTLPAIPLALLSALPDLGGKNIFLYAGYVLLGFLLATDGRIIDIVESKRKFFLISAAAGMAEIFIEMNMLGYQSGFSTAGVLFSILHFFIFWITLLAIVGYGKRYLNRKNRFMAYFSPAAFPVYILHQTYIIVLGYFILAWPVLMPLQFILIAGLSFAASIASWEGIRRLKPLKILFGVK